MGKKSKLLLAAIILFTQSLCAEETQLPENTLATQIEENESEQLKHHRSKDFTGIPLEDIAGLDDETQEEVQEETQEEPQVKSFNKKGYQDYQTFPSYIHGGLLHYWVSCSLDWSVFQLEDGSQWVIAFEDRFRIVNWHSSHPLVFRKNNYWDSNSGYKYQLYNTVLSEAIQVNNLVGPYYAGPYTREITYADSFFGDVHLTDGSTWSIYFNDEYKMNYWRPGHAVIIGISNENEFFRYPYDYILMNIELDNSVRAEWDQR